MNQQLQRSRLQHGDVCVFMQLLHAQNLLIKMRQLGAVLGIEQHTGGGRSWHFQLLETISDCSPATAAKKPRPLSRTGALQCLQGAYLGMFTLILALGVSPNISGAYSASARVGGRANSPALFRRTVYSTLVVPAGRYW